MINQVVIFVLNGLIRNGLVKESEIELYRFGINRLLLCFINIATTVVIGALCDMVWQSIIFSAAYIPLRRYAGGYHAKTPQSCYILSSILIFGVLQLVKCFPENEMLILVIALLSGVGVFLKAPVESVNKPLNKKECEEFKKRTRIIVLVEMLIVLFILQIYRVVAICIALSIFCSMLMLVIPARHGNLYEGKKG